MLSMYDNEQYFFEALQGRRVGLRAEVGGRPRPGGGLPGGRARRAVPVPRCGERADPRLPQRRGRRRCPSSILTPREEEIVKLIAEGNSSKEIADTLVISVKTVDRHRANVLAKLGMRDRLDLTRYAIRAGLVEP